MNSDHDEVSSKLTQEDLSEALAPPGWARRREAHDHLPYVATFVLSYLHIPSPLMDRRALGFESSPYRPERFAPLLRDT